MISHVHRLVFVHVPKCAGMAVEASLGGLPAPQRSEQHARGHKLRERYPDVWRDYTQFAIVRHPVARAHSYIRFFRRFDAVWRRHLPHVDDATLLRDAMMSVNLLTQRTCAIMLTGEEQVLTLEALDTAWPAFAAEHDLPRVLPRVNEAPSRPKEPLPPAVVLMIEALFADDFDRFGYDRSGIALDDLDLPEQGAVLWARLRAWALDAAAGGRGIRDPQAAALALDAWVDTLPVAAWRDRWHATVRDLPPPLRVGGEPVPWTEAVHEAINIQLGAARWEPWTATG